MKNVTATVVLLSVVLLGVYGERPGVKAEAGGPRLEAATEMEEHPLKAISRDAAEKMLRWVLFKINLKNKEMESPLKKMVSLDLAETNLSMSVLQLYKNGTERFLIYFTLCR